MVYEPQQDHVAPERDREILVTESGGNTGVALLAGALVVLAIVLLVWLLGANNSDPSGTTGAPLETTVPVELTIAPTETVAP
jgi:hypothetical protein